MGFCGLAPPVRRNASARHGFEHNMSHGKTLNGAWDRARSV